MNRWPLLSHTAARACLAGALAMSVGPASFAQSAAPSPAKRVFPANALRAQMVVVNAHEVTLNGATTRLSPGSRIRTPANALTVSGGLVGQSFVVNYTRDSLGQAHEVWILNAAEAADRRTGSEGMFTTNVVSGHAATE